eukprot:2894177-Karenia_brevis.AAC.1
MPGSVEALSHWRTIIEELIKDGTLEPMVAADLDLVNMFGNTEWPAIRQSVEKHFAEALSWTQWQHEEQSVATLPSGATFSTNRGAEQGDVFGSVQSALTLGDARDAHFARSGTDASCYAGACDEWYVDDGQVFVRPMLFDKWLRALDAAIATFGATRGQRSQDNVKSSCRLICPLARRAEFQGWDTPYVRDSVDVLSSDEGTTALGAPIGEPEFVHHEFVGKVREVTKLRDAIGDIGHCQTELVLTRQCADVSKIVYCM